MSTVAAIGAGGRVLTVKGTYGCSLRSIAIFKDLSDAALARLSQACNWSSFHGGEEIVPYLDESDDVYFLVNGSAQVMLYSRTGKAVAFRTIETGSLFGELAAIDHAPRSARVEAVGPCVVARLTAETFRRFMREEPAMMEAVSRHLVAQIRELTARVFSFSTLSVKTRIQAEILRLAGAPEAGAAPCRIKGFPTHGDFAERVSTHREAVTRELGRLARAGIVCREGRDLVLLDIDGLRAMIDKGSDAE